MSDFTVATGSSAPTPNIIGRVMQLKQPYQGRTEATVVEMIGRNALGVPLYGCHLDDYMSNGQPITVDFAANEFAGEHGEAYQEQADRGFQWLHAVFTDGIDDK